MAGPPVILLGTRLVVYTDVYGILPSGPDFMVEVSAATRVSILVADAIIYELKPYDNEQTNTGGS